MPPDNYFTVIVQSITDLLTRHSDMFVDMGGRLFRGFAIILISWFGVKMAPSSSHEHQAFHFGNFAGLLLTIAFGFTMITYYDSPIPGFGISFKYLVMDQSFFLARQIEVLFSAALFANLLAGFCYCFTNLGPPFLRVLAMLIP